MFFSGCVTPATQIQQQNLVEEIPAPTPAATPTPTTAPTIDHIKIKVIPEPTPEPTPTPVPKINPDKIRLKLSYIPHPNTHDCGTCAYLSLIIFNEGETNLTNLIIYFVQSGGKDPDSWNQLFGEIQPSIGNEPGKYIILPGKPVWEKILIRKHPEYWEEMSYYIELDGKMVELTNYETSWD